MSDGFNEFTDRLVKEKKCKDKWLFTKKDEPIFWIAGRSRSARPSRCRPLAPGPAPYYDQQIIVLDRAAWADWLDPSVSAFRPSRSSNHWRPECTSRRSNDLWSVFYRIELPAISCAVNLFQALAPRRNDPPIWETVISHLIYRAEALSVVRILNVGIAPAGDPIH